LTEEGAGERREERAGGKVGRGLGRYGMGAGRGLGDDQGSKLLRKGGWLVVERSLCQASSCTWRQ
jgi:hypothetical protein